MHPPRRTCSNSHPLSAARPSTRPSRRKSRCPEPRRKAYASKLRAAGVPVTVTRYQGIVHDFVMLNVLRPTQAAQAAITQAITFIRDRFSLSG